MDSNLALARFFRSLASAANQLAADLTEIAAAPPPPSPTTISPEALVQGPRQRAIVQIPALRTDLGLKTAQIAQAIGNPDVPNVYLAMRALEKRGLIELIPNSEPQRWRLTENFREPPAA